MPTNTVLTERPERAAPRPAASVTWDVSATPLLTPSLRALLDDFLIFVQHGSQDAVAMTEIRGFHDPEEDTEQIIVRQWTPLSAPAASAYLEALGQRVEAWMDTLAPEAKTLFLERIAFQLRRGDHARL
jgi:hypothetical protein